MTSIPLGYLGTVLFVAWCTWCALIARHTPRMLASLCFYAGFVINEIPVLALLWLLGATLLAFVQGDIRAPDGWVCVGLALVTAGGLGRVAWRGMRAIRVVQHALDVGLGRDWRDTIGPKLATQVCPRFRFIALLGPFFRRRSDVERVANIRYGPAGGQNLLDIYRHRSHPTNAPVLIHLHGGAFVRGTKNREALPLLYRLAHHGWVCISANYRLQPAAAYPDPLIDAKKVIAWVRTQSMAYGMDPTLVFIAGGSAGGQLAAQAALTANDPTLQPGFERADTAVTAAIVLYGYFGWVQQGFFQQHAARTPAMPPCFVIHGDSDSLCSVEDARHFVHALRNRSVQPVVYAELPGAQHTFDLFHSLRTEAAIDGIASFAAWVRAQSAPDAAGRADRACCDVAGGNDETVSFAARVTEGPAAPEHDRAGRTV